ncbi:N-acetyltransferase [Prolixibacteraceae bacterium JC049]|nr:N-acetyltransferase [Prolixibacteraceae bacterium JC049]
MIKVNTEIELKQLELSDTLDIFNTIDSQREYLGKWLPFVEFTKALSDTENFISSAVNAPKDKFEYIFVIKKLGKFVGLIGFKDTDGLNNKTEMGYWLSQDYQKQGIVTQSVEKLCEFAFNKLHINRIQIKCAVENHPSRNVPKRLGFQFEGIERDGELLTGNVYTDLEIYSKLKGDK